LWLIFVPANTSSRPVLIDSSLPEFIHITASELRHFSAQFLEKRRKATRRFHGTPAVVVPKSEADHTPVANMTVKLEMASVPVLPEKPQAQPPQFR
jgi:hypothetical protein